MSLEMIKRESVDSGSYTIYILRLTKIVSNEIFFTHHRVSIAIYQYHYAPDRLILRFNNVSPTVKKFSKKIFPSLIEEGTNEEVFSVTITDTRQIAYMKAVMAGAKWSTALRGYLEDVRQKTAS